MPYRYRRLSAGLSALALALALPAAAWAAGYLKIGDIKGESTDKGHGGEIEILSWSWGESRTSRLATERAARPEAVAGRRQHKPVTFIKAVDRASPKLQEASANGTRFPSLVLTVPDPDRQQAYLVYEFRDALITSYQVHGLSGDSDSRPTESVTFTYGEVKKTPGRPTAERP